MESIRLRERLLVLRTQTGDEEAFSELFRLFGEKTHRYLVSLLGSSDAEDAQQEVWLSVYGRIRSLTNPAGFRTWLFQITRNRAIDLMRRNHRERAFLAEAEPLLGRTDSDADQGSELFIEDEAISIALESLSPQHREVLVLRYWEDLDYPEMALVIGAPVGTVRSRLFHAKRKLQERLEPRQSSTT